jgi:hypothetical protein
MRRRLRNNTYRKTPFAFWRFKVSVWTDRRIRLNHLKLTWSSPVAFSAKAYLYLGLLDD